jgi:hypothetical protein
MVGWTKLLHAPDGEQGTCVAEELCPPRWLIQLLVPLTTSPPVQVFKMLGYTTEEMEFLLIGLALIAGGITNVGFIAVFSCVFYRC